MADLKGEFEYYLLHKAEFLTKYQGQYIVLKDHKVLGAYPAREQAIEESLKTQALGTFIVQHVVENDDQVRFHSRHAG